MKLTLEQNNLIEQYYHLVPVYARKHQKKFKVHTYDEYYDACMKALIKTVRSYEASKGDFVPLYIVAARNECLKVIRYHETDKRRGELPLSFDWEYEGDEKSGTLYDAIGHEDQYHFLFTDEIGSMIKVLNDQEKQYIHLHFYQNKSQRQIALMSGYSQMQISRVIRKALDKMKKHGVVG